MISRRYLTRGGNLELRTAPVPEASVQLERNGFAMLPDVLSDDEIYERRGPVAPIGRAGDVVFFVSDVWHRRMPTGPGDTGRFFLQAQYGRRDIAQRLRTTNDVHHLSPEAIARAITDRERIVVGLHPTGFYDG